MFLIPAGAILAPCCAEAIEACCPLDRACEEGEVCPKTTTSFAAVPTDVPASLALPAVTPVLVPVALAYALPAALERSVSAPARVPLRI